MIIEFAEHDGLEDIAEKIDDADGDNLMTAEQAAHINHILTAPLESDDDLRNLAEFADE